MPTVRKIPPPTADQLVDAPTDFPTLTRGDVHAWVGETMLQRGAPYVGDALFNLRRTGRALKARCQGTASQPYRVEATIKAEGGIERDDCTCPVGGRCKHVAALLLAWLDDPDAFAEVAETEVDTALEGRSKAELIALIHQMLARFPELESLLSMPLPVADARLKPADPALIRREVVGAFRDQLTGASSGGRQDVTKGGLVRTAQRDRSPGRRWQALSREMKTLPGAPDEKLLSKRSASPSYGVAVTVGVVVARGEAVTVGVAVRSGVAVDVAVADGVGVGVGGGGATLARTTPCVVLVVEQQHLGVGRRRRVVAAAKVVASLWNDKNFVRGLGVAEMADRTDAGALKVAVIGHILRLGR